MPYVAVLDACVLYSMPLADTLLRLGEEGLYRPVWSTRILEELRGALLKRAVEPWAFPPAALAAFGLEVQPPDAFLVHQHWLDRDVVVRVLREQQAALGSPPMPMDEFLRRVAAHAPVFAGLVGPELSSPSAGRPPLSQDHRP